MFLPISNEPRDYAWGSPGAISRWLGRPATSAIEAELWLGAHPGSPARVSYPELNAASDGTLDRWIALNRSRALGERERLPYLLKLLSAGAPLSLQVHPSRAQAQAGCAREDALGIPRDAAERNYRDDNHKPELIVALEDGFVALCGIRPEHERLAILLELGLAERLDAVAVSDLFAELLRNRTTPEVRDLIAEAVVNARGITDSPYGESYRWLIALAEAYPGDPGALLSLMLNLVILKAGEALYLPAGNLHAYLRGIGVELMSDSDNVLRGGLSSKHIDVDELLAVTNWSALPVPRLEPERVAGALRFRGEVPDFELLWVDGTAEVELSGPAIVLNLGTEATLHGAHSGATLARGEARFVTPDEQSLHLSGERLVLAQPRS